MKKLTASASIMGAASWLPALSGCAIASGAGPSTRSIGKAPEEAKAAGVGIQIVDVTDAVARRILASSHGVTFSEELGEGQPIESVVGKDNILDVTIWGAPLGAWFRTIRNKDVLHVSNAPLADAQKFVNVVCSTFLPVATTAAAF